jgi:hypothetical protein
VVSISTTRLTPSASGFAHAVFGCVGMGGLAGTVPVTSTSSCIGIGLAEAVAASRSAGGALTVAATAKSARGEEAQNQTAAITTAAATLANIRPNALRMIALPRIEF